MTIGIVALSAVVVVLVLAVVIGRKSEPFELEKDLAPGVKPFVPSEEMGILGTRRIRVQEILAQGGTEIPLEDLPNSPQVEQALRRASKQLDAGQAEEAAEILTTALASDPDNPDLLLALGDAYNAMQLYDKSLEVYSRADAIIPGDVSVLLRLGETCEQLEQSERALAAYNQVLVINPEDAEAADAVERLGIRPAEQDPE